MPANLSLYFHWPFCVRKCKYCAFNSYPIQNDYNQLEKILIQKYLQELSKYRQRLGAKKISSIFLGGGTPSLLCLQSLQRLLNHIDRLWGINRHTEISMEINPHSSQQEELILNWKNIGINRISIGVQALNDTDLKNLGRLHSRQDAINTISNVAKHFDNYSIDLIYGRYQQSLAAWQAELQEAITLSPHHLSLYQLTVEPGTPLAQMVKQYPLPPESTILSMFNYNRKFLISHHFKHYEISNFAKSNHMCKHNLAYWQNAAYLGIGPGAHSRLDLDSGKRLAISATKNIQAWLQKPVERQSVLNTTEQLEEYVLMHLRLLTQGINKADFQQHFGKSIEQLCPSIEFLTTGHFLRNLKYKLVASAKGIKVLDLVTTELLTRNRLQPNIYDD